MNRYKMGNCLRGYYEAEYESMEAAVVGLGAIFDGAFPSSHGRSVQLYVLKINPYGFEEWMQCADIVTKGTGTFHQ